MKIAQEKRIQYGPSVSSKELIETIDHVFMANDRLTARGKQPRPVTIWGRQGIGKTEIVRDFCRTKGWDFSYCAPAQFEEMGDFHGIPVVVPADDHHGPNTTYAPPTWVPRRPGPGILLFDDVNRADDRILRGIMQLLQRSEMFSWRLPERWHVVCTANPEHSGYSVTPMDDAMITRMVHLWLEFDPRSWAMWAAEAGVDQRFIDFVLQYPELVQGQRTTPRTLVDFSNLVSDLGDLAAAGEMVSRLGHTSVDEQTVSAFISFVFDELPSLISPEEVLTAADPSDVFRRISAITHDHQGSFRADRMSVMLTRLQLALFHGYVPLQSVRKKNLLDFLMGEVPADMRLSFWKDLAESGKPEVRALIQDPRLANAILGQREAK
jgi:MoxR-like ATPase